MDRDRLTITLRKDLLIKIDNLIDKTTIRNRSHAIETVIEKFLVPKIETAVILAGGAGINLRPLTYEIPKSLLPIQSKALTQYSIELLKKFNIKNVVFCIGPLGEKIKDHFGNGDKFGIRISYSEESSPLGTAGALKKASSLISGTFLAMHGDILAKINLADMFNFHSKQKTVATMALTTKTDAEIFGTVRLQGTQILEFKEKNKGSKSLSLLINAGIYIFEPSIFGYIPKNRESYLEKDIFPLLARDKQLSGFAFDGDWFDITTAISYEKALKSWNI